MEKAKEKAYQLGFYEGIMNVGEYKGMKVRDAKPLVKKLLIDKGMAVEYFEPENQVIGRQKDICVVAKVD